MEFVKSLKQTKIIKYLFVALIGSIILAISIKTISNYTNHIFHTELDTVFKSREWKGYKATRGFINLFRRLE